MSTLESLRRSYQSAGLHEADAAAEPMAQFQRWLDDALAAALLEPNAMTLASVDAAGQPHARIVLLRGFDARGFAFYTNYDSDKGRQLAAEPRVALCFHWPELARQVRVEGQAMRIGSEESDSYFASRPRGHQLGAWASPQSSVIASREWLAQNCHALEQRYPGEVPRPPAWGGYRVAPTLVEFWQGQANRLHDRLRYRREGSAWVRERLAP